MKINKTLLSRLIQVVSSTGFFWFILGLLVFQALWLAFSAVYPMAFDEDFHLGLIKLYAHHPNPFWDGQPAGADAFGAIARDPSYLFHYLMSFPYRLISVFTDSQYAHVMILRLLNIGLFVWGLAVYRRLLQRTKASAALVNLSLLVFVLIPIVPYLAAQINYDNLLLPLTAWSLLLAIKLRHSMKAGAFNVRILLELSIVMMAASLVKYGFLPIFAVIVAYLLFEFYKYYGTPAKLIDAIRIGRHRFQKWLLIVLSLATVLMAGLFVERYGVNLVKYHTPSVDCGDVLDYDHCKAYGPWIRDYNLEKTKAEREMSIQAFTVSWVHGMWFRSFFAVSGASNDFANKGPLTLPAIGTIVFAASGVVAFIVTVKKLWRRYPRHVIGLLTATSLVYLLSAFWVFNYPMYLQTHIPVAINGRYLLPVIPIVVLLAALGVNELLGHRTRLKGAIGVAVILCLIWGGGFLTYVLRSQDNWYWANTPLKPANHAIQDVLGPVTPGYRHPQQYMP